ncbi:MAG: glycosyltransferase [Flavobacteriales bacterium]|nr:glycosyltransferase [Flavobacteriales bacterium]
MKVSIITVAYNAEETIEDTLKSLAAQDYPDIEHILIDGGSTDATLDIARKYEAGIEKIVSEPDNGIYDAMNKGLALCTGDLIGILNSDDAYADGSAVSDVVRTLQASTTAAACYADLDYVDRNNPDKVVRRWVSGPYKRSAFRAGWMPPHPAFFLKREAYEAYGNFNTDLRTSADYELMLRMLYKHRLEAVYLNRVIVKMKTGGQSNVSLKNRLKSNREDRAAWLINGLKPRPGTFVLKPLRKIGQFFRS